MVKVRLLYFEDCPSWQTADGHLHSLADEIGYTAQATHAVPPDAWLSARGAGSNLNSWTCARFGPSEMSTGRSIEFCSAIE